MSKLTTQQRLGALMVLAAVFLLFSRGQGCSLPSIGAPATTLIVMLYEADHGPLSPEALGAANQLREAGFEVRPVDDDVLNGEGEVPTWLKPALEPGRAAMGGSDGQDDALIVLAGERVVKAIKLPATKEAILEAVK